MLITAPRREAEEGGSSFSRRGAPELFADFDDFGRGLQGLASVCDSARTPLAWGPLALGEAPKFSSEGIGRIGTRSREERGFSWLECKSVGAGRD